MRLFIFLAIFLSIYGSVHLYWYLKFKRAFVLGSVASLVCVLFMISMLLAPLLTRYLERHHLEMPARCLAYVGYFWMGYLFLFFATGLLVDGYRILLAGVARLFETGGALQLSARQAFVIPLLAAAGITCFGFYEARNITIERVTLQTPKLTRAAGRLKIAQISDVHLGLIVGAERLQKIATLIEAEKPDVLVSTGDLVDGRFSTMSGLAAMLRRIPTPHGKYAVTGNHEFYAGLNRTLQITRDAGFKTLRGEAVSLPGLIGIAGVDDPAGRRWGNSPPVSEKALRAALPRDQFALLLKHQPRLAEAGQGLFDLQLSGHTHKGQIFPFGLIVKYFFPYDSGLFTLADQSHLYVNRGTGTWGPPIRFLAPPEVTIIELVSTEK